MIFLPFTLSFIVGLLANARRGVTAPEWLPLAQKVAGVIGLVYLVFPFWFQKLVTRNPNVLRARGKDPEEAVLLVATTCSALPTVLAFFLCILGGPAKHVYCVSVISVIGSLYWAWRYRHLYSELQI